MLPTVEDEKADRKDWSKNEQKCKWSDLFSHSSSESALSWSGLRWTPGTLDARLEYTLDVMPDQYLNETQTEQWRITCWRAMPPFHATVFYVFCLKEYTCRCLPSQSLLEQTGKHTLTNS